MPDLAELVPIAAKADMNIGLSSAREDTMLSVFGPPGPLTPHCSDPTGGVAALMVSSVEVGPFRISGLRMAVESLRIVLSGLSNSAPWVIAELKTAGMLCVRSRRSNPAKYSNHSWGTAIDLYFGVGVVPQGKPYCQRGFLDLYPAFNALGWYWGAEFSGDSVDSMHFEVAEETILKWHGHAAELLTKAAGVLQEGTGAVARSEAHRQRRMNRRAVPRRRKA